MKIRRERMENLQRSSERASDLLWTIRSGVRYLCFVAYKRLDNLGSRPLLVATSLFLLTDLGYWRRYSWEGHVLDRRSGHRVVALASCFSLACGEVFLL